MTTKFRELMERANRIGALLPESIEDVDVDDEAAVAELKVILREFGEALDAIEKFEAA